MPLDQIVISEKFFDGQLGTTKQVKAVIKHKSDAILTYSKVRPVPFLGKLMQELSSTMYIVRDEQRQCIDVI